MSAKLGPIPLMAVLASGCVMAAACASAGAWSKDGAFRPSGTTTPSPTRHNDTSDILDRYRLFHQVFEQALETNDESGIGEVADGPIAARLIRTVRAQRRAGVVRRGHDLVRPRLAALRVGSGHGSAVVHDCVITHGLWTYRMRTGARVGRPPRPQRTRLRTVLTLTETGWKVVETSVPRRARC